jgi:hypothetical protein
MQLKVLIALVFATLAAAAPAEVIARSDDDGLPHRPIPIHPPPPRPPPTGPQPQARQLAPIPHHLLPPRPGRPPRQVIARSDDEGEPRPKPIHPPPPRPPQTGPQPRDDNVGDDA